MAKLTMEYPQYGIQQRSKKEHSLDAYKKLNGAKGYCAKWKKASLKKSHTVWLHLTVHSVNDSMLYRID